MAKNLPSTEGRWIPVKGGVRGTIIGWVECFYSEGLRRFVSIPGQSRFVKA